MILAARAAATRHAFRHPGAGAPSGSRRRPAPFSNQDACHERDPTRRRPAGRHPLRPGRPARRSHRPAAAPAARRAGRARRRYRRGTVHQGRCPRPHAGDGRGHRTAAGSAGQEGGRDRYGPLAERRDGAAGPGHHARSAARLPRALPGKRPRARAGWAKRAGDTDPGRPAGRRQVPRRILRQPGRQPRLQAVRARHLSMGRPCRWW